MGLSGLESAKGVRGIFVNVFRRYYAELNKHLISSTLH